ncbi:hypothetical protein FH5T_10580 [Draconibacterium orientale]|uniref:Uncharacterized protein n=1 Tax=Draconibacterium orientale TaxID=1168034 RepID=A0ABN4D2X6_9BACT|nr:hypothetical protein [Draconibacterium orientale]AHW61895.1 hypothetical protein FH5T_10580 [Draconibacterium orientale]
MGKRLYLLANVLNILNIICFRNISAKRIYIKTKANDADLTDTRRLETKEAQQKSAKRFDPLSACIE